LDHNLLDGPQSYSVGFGRIQRNLPNKETHLPEDAFDMERHHPINLPQSLPLWPEGKTVQSSEDDQDFPTFTYYLPSDEYRTGRSMLILPGGGYHLVSSAKEGHRPAQWLAARGMATAVLEYRHHPRRFPVPLLDAQRGMRLVRSLANAHGLDSGQVGVMGFSAGGHLAGLVTTQPPHPESEAGDDLDRLPTTPDFWALIYGVVSFVEGCAHTGSPVGLLGEKPEASLLEQCSIERALADKAPPLFLAHGQNDTVVPVENALLLYRACLAKGVPVTMHLYEDFRHGIGMGAMHPWCDHLLQWLV